MKKNVHMKCVSHIHHHDSAMWLLCVRIWNFYQWIKLLCCLNGRAMVGKRERGGWEKWAKLPIDVRLTRFSWPRKRKMNCRRATLTHTHNGFRTHVKNTAISSQTDSHKLAQCGKQQKKITNFKGFYLVLSTNILVLKSDYFFCLLCASAATVANKTLFTFCDHVNSAMKNYKQHIGQ